MANCEKANESENLLFIDFIFHSRLQGIVKKMFQAWMEHAWICRRYIFDKGAWRLYGTIIFAQELMGMNVVRRTAILEVLLKNIFSLKILQIVTCWRHTIWRWREFKNFREAFEYEVAQWSEHRHSMTYDYSRPWIQIPLALKNFICIFSYLITNSY